MHHIVSDGWSVNHFLKELFHGYRACHNSSVGPLPPLSVSYRDYAIWQREWLQGSQRERDLAYWKTTLADAPHLLNLSLDGVRSELQQTEGSQIIFALSEKLTTRLRAVSRREKATLFMILLAGWKTLLYLYSGQNNIVVGFPVAGRRIETEHFIGLFVNTLVLRTFFSANLTFHQLLQQIKNSTLDAYKHQNIPFQKILYHLEIPRTSTYHPLFQVMFDLHNYQEQELAVTLPDLAWELLPVETGTAKFDLCLTLYEEATEISGKLEYNTHLFREETIRQFIAEYLQILERMVSDLLTILPEQKKNTRHGLDNGINKDIIRAKDEEYALLLMNWNTTERAYPLHLPYHVLFEQQVIKTPTAVAVICGAEQLTYAELNSAANRLAAALVRRGIQMDSIVPLLAERSIAFLTGILAILKAGVPTLLAIQIVYKARQLGMPLRPSHLMKYQTVAELANVVQNDNKFHADQGILTGEIALTPIQRSFFSSIEGSLHHWNQFMLLTPCARLHSNLIHDALRILMSHHDILRARFDDTVVPPRQYMLKHESVVPYDMVDMTHVPLQKRAQYLEQQCDAIQSTLNFTAGPILRCIYFQGDSAQEDRLFFVIHHLVVDGFSWRILLQDFQFF